MIQNKEPLISSLCINIYELLCIKHLWLNVGVRMAEYEADSQVHISWRILDLHCSK